LHDLRIGHREERHAVLPAVQISHACLRHRRIAYVLCDFLEAHAQNRLPAPQTRKVNRGEAPGLIDRFFIVGYIIPMTR
jgi:hypothetical protein